MSLLLRSALILPILLVAACATTPMPEAIAPADAFFARLSTLCGKAFAGRLAVFNEGDSKTFAGPAVMHVRQCTASEIRIPFHAGDNRSRTWVITRTATGLRLKHDHRHEDGSEDKLTQYGGDTIAPGAAGHQEFPADAFSKALFEREKMPVSIDNVWAVEVEPGQLFAYELRRPNRHFRVEFDLATPVPLPPAPWGSHD